MKNQISTKKVLNSMFWVYCENISAQLMSFIVTVVLARFLLPSDYGTIALVTVFINIANVFVSSSFSMSLVQKRDVDYVDFNTIFWFNFFMAIFIYVLLFFCASPIASYYDNMMLKSIIRILSIRIPLSAYNSVQVAYVSRGMVFKKSFFSTALGSLISGGIGIAFAFLGMGLWALVAQSISNIMLNTLLLVFVVEWTPKREFSFERLKTLFAFGWKLLVTGLMFTGYSELRSLIIGKRYSTENLGFYSRGSQFPQLVASNIDTSITRVMFPALANNQDNSDAIRNMTRRAAKTSAYIMTPILFGLAIVAENLVSILLTDKWLPCVPYLQVMCLVWWLQPTQSCSIQALKAIGKSGIYLRIEIISKVIGILLLIGSIVVINTPLAVAVSMLLSQICAMVIYGIYISKYIGYKLKTQLADLLLPALLGGVMLIFVYCVGSVIFYKIASMIVQIVAGAIVYILLSILLKVEEFKYLYNIVLGYWNKKGAN